MAIWVKLDQLRGLDGALAAGKEEMQFLGQPIPTEQCQGEVEPGCLLVLLKSAQRKQGQF
jgi:hypothetical protein